MDMLVIFGKLEIVLWRADVHKIAMPPVVSY